MGCGGSVPSKYAEDCKQTASKASFVDTREEAQKPTRWQASSLALQIVDPAGDVGEITAPQVNGQHVFQPSAGHACTKGPWDKDDLSYGPGFGPETLDQITLHQLSVQPASYVVGGVLAETDNCNVHLAALIPGRRKVAVKRISREHSSQPYRMHVNEVRCLMRLQHPHILKLLGVCESHDALDMLLEYFPRGALRDYVRISGECQQVLTVLRDIVEALIYMHGEWFAHLDLKPHNILVEDLSSAVRGKLCDFGTTTRIGASGCLCGIMGTPGYRAPEIDTGDEFNAYKADVWSMGKVAAFVEECSGGRLGVEYICLLGAAELRPSILRCRRIFSESEASNVKRLQFALYMLVAFCAW
ncbi:unnamed protein product, partial [Effrenium voratum]